jgi:hypothetical protein
MDFLRPFDAMKEKSTRREFSVLFQYFSSAGDPEEVTK